MGHVEPGSTPAVARPKKRRRLTTIWREGDASHPAWALWWKLKRHFSLFSAPASWFGTPGSWTYFGNDFVTGLRRNDSTQAAFDLLDAAPDLFQPVHDLAALNLKRHQEMFQFIALLYITVPLTIVLGLADLMPQGVINLFMENQRLVLYLTATLVLGAGIYLVGLWRARQLMSVLELWRIERGVPPVPPLKGPETPPRPTASV